MQSSVLNDLAEAKRRWSEKKGPMLWTHTRDFFFRPTPLGFRQVVPHVQLHGKLTN